MCINTVLRVVIIKRKLTMLRYEAKKGAERKITDKNQAKAERTLFM